MNSYAWITVISLVVTRLVSALAALLDLKSRQRPEPPELAGLLSAEQKRKGQRYAAARVRLGLLEEAVGLAALLLFWFLEGFALLDQWSRGWQWGPVATGVAVLGLLLLAGQLLGLPFSLYRTFVIEARFGFNRTTPALFLLDRLKGVLLTVILGGPLLAGVLALFQRAGEWAWLWGWGFTSAFLVTVQYLLPTWIMPLFNRFDPLPDGPLKEAVTTYATAQRFPLAEVLVMDGSRRSSKANAFFTGFGKRRRIALFDTLIQAHTVPELVAVLAHEIGHYRLGHIPRRLLLGILHLGVTFALLAVTMRQQGLFDAFFVDFPSIHLGLIFFALLYTPVEWLLSIGGHWLSRRWEYAADHFAATTIPDREALASALRKLTTDQLGNPTPHPLYVALNASHPPVAERIRTIRRG